MSEKFDLNKFKEFLGNSSPEEAKISKSIDRHIEMNDNGIIEVTPNEQPKTIATSSLAGCLAIAVIVEDPERNRRAGLAHFDPMSLKMSEVYGHENSAYESLKHLFATTSRADSGTLVKTYVLIMSTDPEGNDAAFVNFIKTEARYLVGNNEPQILKYNQVGDFLEISLPATGSGKPTIKTSTYSTSLEGWK